ncbi:MAG: sugar phosphate isomerase/epimerase [Treponema sp.]|jgi:sugar phosphate isomerase/epimerase|nr:sugar phosphate isomerase/epimerase [Treponema sp.]
MGTIKRSLAISSLFPKTLESWEDLEKTVRFLEGYSFTQLEFYHPPGHDRQIAKLFTEAGFSSILIGVIALKGAGFSLCTGDKEERSRAVSVLKSCMDRASEIGSHGVMLNSGFVPGYSPDPAAISIPTPEQLKAACDAYVHSIEEAAEYGEQRGYNITLLLEPGDSKVQSFQLLGPTDKVMETTERIKKQYQCYALIMDVAHLREEGEDVMSSLRRTLPYCDHIHFCNCVMDDPSRELYGDKHVDFDYPGACWNYGDFENMYRNIRNLYKDRDFTIALEITCRATDNEAWFADVASRCSWIFED